MQLQAERDYFVHGGIGGGSSSSSSSSSSPSCSPPKESPLSLIKVNNLKKPRTKAREEKEKRKASDVDTASAVSSSVASAIPLGQPSHNLNGDINVTIDIDVNVNRDINPRKNATDISKTDTLCNCQETEQNSIKAEAMVETQSNHLHTEPMDSESTSADLAPQLPSSLQPASSFLSLYPLAIPAPPPAPTASSAISKHVHATITGHTKSVSRHQEQNSVRSPQKNVPAMDTSISYSSCKTIPVSSLIPVSAGAAASTILLSTREDVSSSIHGYVPSGSLSILATDRLSQLPWELLFHIFCLLDAFDLSCVAQTSKLCARMANDNSLWRIKSMQHPLFMERHLQGHRGPIPWREYYKHLHCSSLRVKQNWTDARPQAVHVLEGHTGMVSALEMSMWTLITASMDSTLRIWDLRTLQCLRVFRSKHSLTCVSQSNAAGVVCARTSFGGLYIWDVKTGELILQDDAAMPQNASFMYMDEKYIGYGQCDGGVTVFDWSSRTSLEVVGSHHVHEGDVIHISILGQDHVISASTNGETLVYSLKRSRIVERILLPHATQAIQFTPTIHEGKVMFSTRDAVYEYELMLDHLSSDSEEHDTHGPSVSSHTSRMVFAGARRGKESLVSLRSDDRTQETLSSMNLRQSSLSSPSTRPSSSSGRVWKPSNSLLSQIRQRIGGTGKAFDQEKQNIPTRFPKPTSIYCLPRTYRQLEHGTTSARDSYGVFLLNNCTHLHEIAVYTRATKQVKQINGPAVDTILTNAMRGRFYTTMECNMHCAVVSSGNVVYVISFLPSDL